MTPREVMQATRSFVPPFELMGSKPRDVKLTGGGKFLYGFAVVMMIGALVATILLSLVASSGKERRRTFQQESVAASAEITRLWRESGDSKQPWVAYQFDANGSTFSGRSKLRLARWRDLQVGSSIEIWYRSSEPKDNYLATNLPGVLAPTIAFVVGGIMLLVSALMFMGINGQRRLLAEGRPAPAIVTKVHKHHSSHGGTHRSINYTFPLLSGSIATGKSDSSSKLPEIGSVICVVYDPDRPKRSRRYPFPLVKTARL